MDAAARGEPLWIFEYLYRDTGNLKTYGHLLLAGEGGQADEIVRSCLDWGNQFVAEQVRIPALCEEHWDAVGEGPSDLDHAFHEFVALRRATTVEAALRPWGTVETLLARMRDAAGRWDVTLSPNCDL